MSRRVFLSVDKLRVSKPGFDAATTAVENLIFHEGMLPVAPFESGSATVAAGGSVSISLTRGYVDPPFIVLKSSLNLTPGPGHYYARFTTGGATLVLLNKWTASMVISYFVFRQFAV